MASCVAGAVGAESFNVYLAVPSTNNTIGGRDLALRKDHQNYEYLMKFDKEQTLNSSMKTSETNGQITSDTEGQNNKKINNKKSPDTENDMEDGTTQELENLKYVFPI